MMRTALFLLGLAMAPGAPAADPLPLPVAVPDGAFRPLDEHLDPELARVLALELAKDPRRQALVAAGKLGVGLVDLEDPAVPRYAAVNGDVMMYAASMPKLVGLLAAHQALADGSLADSPALQQDLAAMIRVSSNPAASAVFDRVGLTRLEAAVRAPAHRFYDPARGGGLWMGRRYASGGPQRAEPMKGLFHAASARQLCRFYHLLATGRLVSRETSAKMLGHMVRPGLIDGFVPPLTALAPGADLYRKSGRWKTWSSDSALVWGGPGKRFILAAVSEAEGGEGLLRALVGVADATLAATRIAVRRPGAEARFTAFHP